jgi:CHASE2 domain-containing sensor protein
VVLLLNALIHSLTLFIQPAAQDETQRQLFDLMTSYKQDLGAGFKRSTKELVTALSACFSLLCLLGGLTIAFLLRKQAEVRIMKGVVGIHVLVFGICFAVMAVFTFLPPIVLTGLIFLSLLLAYFLMPRQQETSL